LDYFTAVALEAAVVIVQADAGQTAGEPIECAGRPDLLPGVVTHLIPAADDIPPRPHLFQEPADLMRVVLQV
jgi:hypothetical protein